MAEQGRFPFPKLNNHNFQTWKFKMEMMLVRDELWYVISEDKPTAATVAGAAGASAATIAQWNKDDRKALATICLCLDDGQSSLVRGAKSAKDVWTALKKYHDKTSDVYLLKKLTKLELTDDGDMEEHLQTFSDLLQRIADVGDEIPAKLQAAMLLCSLPDSYDSLTTALEQRPQEELTLDLIKSKLLAEAEKRKERSGAAGTSSGKALKVGHRYIRGGGGQSGASNKEETRVCYHCKQPGHLKRNCREFLKESNKEGHSNQAKKEEKPKAKANQAQSVSDGPLAWMIGFGEPADWFVDSGASRHMTGNRSFFSKLQKAKCASVILADGEKSDVHGVGEGSLYTIDGNGEAVEVLLTDVLFVPRLTSGLISVSTLIKKEFTVVFSRSGCEIRKPNGVVVAVAGCHGNMYRLCTPERAMVCVQPSHTPNCLHTWHRRLGHRDPDVVRSISTNGLADGMKVVDCNVREVCQCCIKGKMARKPFPKQCDRGSKAILDLVHMDLCGPMASTPSGNKYFLSIVDDYSRMSFTYLLRKKSDAAGKIKDFIAFSKTQFGKTPRVLQSDGGGEFIGRELQTFLRSEGIVSQFSAPYSPQQNGVAERRNRYLKEMTLCLLLEGGLEEKYWGEAVLTATYVQNRLPSRAIGMSPFERWYGRKPSYEHFRIFGSDAWVQIPAERRKKMEPKAQLLTFVGYSNEHKAFRFLDKTSGRITISRDVKFLEDMTMDRNIGCDERNEQREEQESTVELPPLPRSEGERLIAEDEEDEEDLTDYDSAEDLFLDEDQEEAIRSEGECEVQRGLPRRANRGVLPQRLKDYVVGTSALVLDEPKTYEEAVGCEKKEEWMKAFTKLRGTERVMKFTATKGLVPGPGSRG